MLTIALTVAAVPICDWSDRGLNPYRGTMSAAVARYTDIPAPVRDRLARRMEAGKYDEVVAITKDGPQGYVDMRDMHWGVGTVCKGPVDFTRWLRHVDEEIGLVYCEESHCLIVPTVCRNVSRVRRASPPTNALATGGPRTSVLDLPGAFADEDPPTLALIDVPVIALPPVEIRLIPPSGGETESYVTRAQLPVPHTLPSSWANPYTFVEPIPEVPIWLMLLSGLGLIAWSVERGRR